MSKDKLIPEIRFPEFKNEGEWDIEKLGVISEIVRGGSPRPIEDYFTTDVNGLNWLKIADVHSDAKYITQTKEKVKKEALSSTREVNSGDLILSNSMSFGRPYILKITTCIHDGWIAIRKISNKTFEGYLYYFISSESSQSYFQTNAAGAAVKNLNAEIIKLLPIYLPKNIKEQQKIASCLSSLDEVIAAHSQKLALLKDHKKGLMQNLFPQRSLNCDSYDLYDENDSKNQSNHKNQKNPGSDNVPKYRFKEFEKDGDWVEKSLEEISIKVQDGTHFSPKSFETGDYLYITSKNVKNGYIELSTAQYISTEEHESIYKRSDVRQGDVLLTKDGTIGQACVNELQIPFSLLSSVAFIRVKPEFSNYFLYHLLVSQIGQKEIESQIAGQALKRITLTKINNFSFDFPSLQEQQKIASCLSYLDALITAQAEKIEQLKLHKKGLMQGLFPKIKD